jgi:hypothetical protein
MMVMDYRFQQVYRVEIEYRRFLGVGGCCGNEFRGKGLAI